MIKIRPLAHLRKRSVHSLRSEIGSIHSPKNLSMAIAIEAAELREEFRFIYSAESIELTKQYKERIANELADIAIATLSFCNIYDVDLVLSIQKKLAQNAQKYPINKA